MLKKKKSLWVRWYICEKKMCKYESYLICEKANCVSVKGVDRLLYIYIKWIPYYMWTYKDRVFCPNVFLSPSDCSIFVIRMIYFFVIGHRLMTRLYVIQLWNPISVLWIYIPLCNNQLTVKISECYHVITYIYYSLTFIFIKLHKRLHEK